ncbi:MAG: hypothetical protein DRI65_13245 [Chloroflexota bacterium]|nr:MAG: hypothetical protein DRI65_13245 [Chloroflexota bacterium]
MHTLMNQLILVTSCLFFSYHPCFQSVSLSYCHACAVF